MTATRPRIPYTYADYRTLPEDMSRRYELLHGDLYMVPAPTTIHQRILGNIYSLLRQYVVAQRLGEVFISPVDVILGEGDSREVTQPDLVFVAASRAGIIKVHGLEGAPDLTIEILSPGTAERDRGYKLSMYARYGVREYWIIDPDARVLEVYTLGPEGYNAPRRHSENDRLTSGLLPGFASPIVELFSQ